MRGGTAHQAHLTSADYDHHSRGLTRDSRVDDSTNDAGSYTEVFAWGSDAQGQIGLGKNPKKDSFYPIPRFCSFNIVIKTLSCGKAHSAFVSEQGNVYAMGSNRFGKLGLPLSEELVYSPQLITMLSEYEVDRISCGAEHSAAVSRTGEVLTWGRNDSGQLGLGDLIDRWNAEIVGIPYRATSVSCGGSHTMVLLDSGSVCGFGSNEFGQVGAGAIGARVRGFQMVRWAEGNTIRSSDEECVQVCSGSFHTLFVLRNGRVLACGDNRTQQLGMTEAVQICDLPAMVPHLEGIVAVATSSTSSAAINSNGDLFLFGGGGGGRQDDTESSSNTTTSNRPTCPVPAATPVRLDKLKVPIRSVSLGEGFGCAIDVQGSLYTWGVKNQVGQLALGHNGQMSNQHMPEVIIALNGKHAVKIACGENFVIALGREVRGAAGESTTFLQNTHQEQLVLKQQQRSVSPFLDECSMNTYHRSHQYATTDLRKSGKRLMTLKLGETIGSLMTPMNRVGGTSAGSRSVKDILRIGKDFEDANEETREFGDQQLIFDSLNKGHQRSCQERMMTTGDMCQSQESMGQLCYQQQQQYEMIREQNSSNSEDASRHNRSTTGSRQSPQLLTMMNAQPERITRSASAASASRNREKVIRLDRVSDSEDERESNISNSNLLGVLGLNRNIEISSAKHHSYSNGNPAGGSGGTVVYQSRFPHSSSSSLSSSEKVRFQSRLSGKENQVPKGLKEVTSFYATDSLFVDSKDFKAAGGVVAKREEVEEEIKRAVRVEVNRVKLELAAERDKNLANVRVGLQIEHRDEVERVRKELVSRSEQHRVVEGKMKAELEEARSTEAELRTANAKLEAAVASQNAKISLLEGNLNETLSQLNAREDHHASIARNHQESMKDMQKKIELLQELILKSQSISYASSAQQLQQQNNNPAGFQVPLIEVKPMNRNDNLPKQQTCNRNINRMSMTATEAPLFTPAVLFEPASDWQTRLMRQQQLNQPQVINPRNSTTEKRSNSLQYWREDNGSVTESPSQEASQIAKMNGCPENLILDDEGAARSREFDRKWGRIVEDGKFTHHSSKGNERIHRGENHRRPNSSSSSTRGIKVGYAEQPQRFLENPMLYQTTSYSSELDDAFGCLRNDGSGRVQLEEKSLNSELLNQSVQSLGKRIVEFERVLKQSSTKSKK